MLTQLEFDVQPPLLSLHSLISVKDDLQERIYIFLELKMISNLIPDAMKFCLIYVFYNLPIPASLTISNPSMHAQI